MDPYILRGALSLEILIRLLQQLIITMVLKLNFEIFQERNLTAADEAF